MEGGGIRNHGYKKGLWTAEEDRILTEYIRSHGKGKWNRVTKVTGLNRCGKSCRLRWMNYLSPTVKRDDFSEEENDLIIRLHKLLGNRWSLIAGRVPGRTDNQVKNHWNSHLRKKLGAMRNYKSATEKSKAKSSSRIHQSTTATCSSDQEASLEKGRESYSAELQQQQPQSNNGGGDDIYEGAASLVGAGGRGSDDGDWIWETTMMGCNNNYYDQSSFNWFYNNNEDGLNLYYRNYFMDDISQDNHHLLHDYPLGLLEGIGL